MRITKINIPKGQINNGLETVKMHKLGQVVLLAGKNGAGKTRLLNLISNTISSKPKKYQVDRAITQIEVYKKTLEQEKVNIENYERAIASENNSDRIKAHEQQITNHKNNIKSYEQELVNYENISNWSLIETNEFKQNYTIVPFVPKGLNIKDCNAYRKAEILNHAKSIDSVGVGSLEAGTFARIQVVQDRWFNATHQNSSQTAEEIESAVNDYDKLKDLIKIFLNADIERSIDGV